MSNKPNVYMGGPLVNHDDEIKQAQAFVETGKRNQQVLLVSGMHGNEQNAVLASIGVVSSCVWSDIDVSYILGLNRNGLLRSVRDFAPVDNKPVTDMNRVFNVLTDKDFPSPEDMRDGIVPVISKSDIVVDVHNSPSCSNMVVIDNNEYAANIVRFCLAHGIQYYVANKSNPGTLKQYAFRMNKLGFTVELNGMTIGPLHGKVIASQREFLINLLAALNTTTVAEIKGLPCELIPYEKATREIYNCGGYGIVEFDERVFAGDMNAELFRKGETFAHIIDMESHESRELKMPCEGWVIDIDAAVDSKTDSSIFAVPGKAICTIQPKINYTDLPVHKAEA